jgi:hypothetical protein
MFISINLFIAVRCGCLVINGLRFLMPSGGKKDKHKKRLTYAMLSSQSDSTHTKACIANHNETRPELR